jgi:ATP-binding cassette subfamily C protein CydC
MGQLTWLLRLSRPYAGWLLGGALLSLLTLLANVGLMAMSGWFISAMALAGAAGVSMNYFTPAAVIRACAILRTAGRYAERLLTHEATFRLLTELRVWFYQRLEPLAPGQLADYHSGDLLSRLRADIDTLDHFYLRLLLPTLVAVAATLLFVLFLAWFDPLLALIEGLMLLLAGVVLPYLIGRRVGSAGRRITERTAQLRSYLISDLQGMAELLVDGAGDRHAERIMHLSETIATEQRHMARLSGLSQGAGSLLANLALGLISLTAIPMIGAGELPPAQLAMLALFTLASFETVVPLPQAFQSLDATLSAARRLREMAEQRPLVRDPERQTDLSRHPALRLQQVSLHYPSQVTEALQRIDLELTPGRRVAIVGPTGSGKSSLLSLLLRFQPPSKGRILIDGRESDEFSAESLRQRLSVVPQQSHLFNTTIRENLLLARPDANQATIEQACRVAEIHDFIQSQPDGYETEVGEIGIRLSGGQIRRLAIARAILKDAPILLMDEPTEGLDPQTAHRVMHNLLTWLQDRSLLLITHRLSDLKAMDEILVLESGRISERGTPHELTKMAGRYAEFYRLGRCLDG